MRAARKLFRLGIWTAIAAALAAVATVVALWVTLPDPAALARESPRTTAVIEQRRAEARARKRPFRLRQTWVGPERFPPVLVQAVLASEDANFFGHEGIDWLAIRDAAEHDLKVGRFARGASTLTQQLAKNLWLGTEKSLWRKLREAVLAAKMERALTKRRILALYLNVVELDDGVFGFEAGARARFDTRAAALTPAQAVVLVSLLPAPRRVDLDRPSTWLKRRSRRLLDRLRDTGHLSPPAHLRASAELERILAGPSPDDDREEPPRDEGGVAPRGSSGPTDEVAPTPVPREEGPAVERHASVGEGVGADEAPAAPASEAERASPAAGPSPSPPVGEGSNTGEGGE